MSSSQHCLTHAWAVSNYWAASRALTQDAAGTAQSARPSRQAGAGSRARCAALMVATLCCSSAPTCRRPSKHHSVLLTLCLPLAGTGIVRCGGGGGGVRTNCTWPVPVTPATPGSGQQAGLLVLGHARVAASGAQPATDTLLPSAESAQAHAYATGTCACACACASACACACVSWHP